MPGIGVAVKCEKLVQSDEKSLCQKDGPRIWNSVGIETILEM